MMRLCSEGRMSNITILFLIALILPTLCASSCLTNRTQIVAPTAAPQTLRVPNGFSVSIIARISSPRHLTFLPSGDLIVGTSTLSIYIVTDADTSNVGTPSVYATISPESELSTNGVVYDKNYVYVGTQYSIWRIPVVPCAITGVPVHIASIRQGPIAPTTEREHTSNNIACY